MCAKRHSLLVLLEEFLPGSRINEPRQLFFFGRMDEAIGDKSPTLLHQKGLGTDTEVA